MRNLLLLFLIAPSVAAAQSSADNLNRLPDGEEKRRFILDCTGCHQFDSITVGQRSRDQWAADVSRMLNYAGAHTGFPVISAYRNAERTADWLHASLSAPAAAPPPAVMAREGRAEVVEYPMSTPGDLLHDVAVDSGGRIIVTGMFTHRMFVLHPETGRLDTVALPRTPAQPRAVELDAAGNWYVLLGAQPRGIARRDVRTGEWRVTDIPMYPHSIGIDGQGRAWFNGHFTVAPEQIGVVHSDGSVRLFDAPPHPSMNTAGNTPIPYELRVGPDGRVWMSELGGNRIIGFDPRTSRFEAFTLPTTFSGPRRFDVDQNGILWIPAYAAGLLVRLDPATGRFTEYPLPVRDAAPYVARVDRGGAVWIGTGAADVVLRFDPRTREFTRYALPSRGAMIRHLAIDPRSGDVWLAYGASPGRISARIARLRVR